MATEVPRFAGPGTFARLPRLDEVGSCDIAILGVPFDAGTSYRPGARFGPEAVRAASKLLRPYHPALGIEPWVVTQVADAGDVACNPFVIEEAIAAIEAAAVELRRSAERIVTIGGDHTIALPLLRAVTRVTGPVALVHFDAHLDTWDTYFGAPFTHGTPFRRAVEEGLLRQGSSVHVGTRGPLYGPTDLSEDERLGFCVVSTEQIVLDGLAAAAAQIRERVGDDPVYVSIDIDVLDPGTAPGTGTPEPGGLTSRELQHLLRSMSGLNIVGADVVEVSPAYDHAEITALAAATLTYELIAVMAAHHIGEGDH